MRFFHLFLLAAAAIPVTSAAQTQKVAPPKTVYWMSAATQSGFGLPGGGKPSTGDIMRMAMGGGGGGATKLLQLDLGSKLTPTGAPMASHAIPPGMAMGAALPLKSPEKQVYREDRVGEEPTEFERPKGKLLLFWGCGETARPGQPVVIDFAKVAEGQIPPGLFAGERVRIQHPPSASTWPAFGEWPNNDRKAPQSVPAGASLIGAHKVSGNYTPDIAFTLSQDWMQPVRLDQKKLPSGAVQLGWNVAPGATAHFAQMMGGGEKQGDGPTVVFWSSSETQTFVSGMTDFVAPAEAQRLVAKKQMMPPAQTSCAIPKEAIAAAQGAIVSLVSHGPEVNMIYPPRPTDPKTPWVQEWAMKARFASRTGTMLGMETAAASGNADSEDKRPKCKPALPGMAGVAGVAGAVAGGLFGKKKQADCRE